MRALQLPKGEAASLSIRHAVSGATATLHKARGESSSHVLLKALVWSLLAPHYPTTVTVETVVHGRFRSDVAVVDGGELCCWGECGSVSMPKLASLFAEFPRAHFIVAKMGRSDLSGYAAQLVNELPASGPQPLVQVISFPAIEESIDRFVTADGVVTVSRDDELLDAVHLGGASPPHPHAIDSGSHVVRSRPLLRR